MSSVAAVDPTSQSSRHPAIVILLGSEPVNGAKEKDLERFQYNRLARQDTLRML
jgi:hypothetical protein